MDHKSNHRDDHHLKLLGSYRTKLAALLLLAALMLLVAACGGETASGGGETSSEKAKAPEGTQKGGGTTQENTAGAVATTPAEATPGPNENTGMLPAGGRSKDPSQPPPQNPPEGVQTYPATSNRSDVELPISYDRDPPTNGDHAPYWQNCGFYSTPVENEAAVHSMDHGVVWITYRPDLPPDQVSILRGYGQEEYVLISPYPGLRAPVVATAWRNQLDLQSADDPRLQQFVDQFRLSQTAPLSGNGCIYGRGEPDVAPPSVQEAAQESSRFYARSYGVWPCVTYKVQAPTCGLTPG